MHVMTPYTWSKMCCFSTYTHCVMIKSVPFPFSPSFIFCRSREEPGPWSKTAVFQSQQYPV